MDSLRYWVTEMHVDGFRFDLAATLARQFHEVDRLSSFFDLVQQDPVVSQVKLIAEPWDVGEGGYQVGNFPPLWTEWNGKYRDTVRDLWRGEPRTLAEFAVAADRLLRPLPGRRPAPAGLHQLRHLPRRLHPARPGLVQREAQRGQRRGQPGRREPQPLLELRGRGRDRGPGGPGAARPPDAQLHRHADALPGRADAQPRRRVRPHPAAATTTRYCQDNELSWVHWPDGRGTRGRRRGGGSGPSCWSSPGPWCGCAATIRSSAAAASSTAARWRAPTTSCRTSRGSPPRARR